MTRNPDRFLDDERWNIVLTRGKGCDAGFVYAVTTTGVYCRPDCPSRRPLRRNVTFYGTPGEAEAAGFRPCKRCASPAPTPSVIVGACRMMDEADEPLSLAALAQAAGLSPWHFHRLFKGAMGMTPRQYAAGRRAERLRTILSAGSQVTAAIYEAGFGSSSRMYERAGETLGMRPDRYRKGGQDEDIRFAAVVCSLGAVAVAATAKGVCMVQFGDDVGAVEDLVRHRFPRARLVVADADLARLVAQVIALIDDPATPVDLPLDIRGTAFQERVWQALRRVPPGEVVSYAELARRIGAPAATRAVAKACASNTIAVAIPCHRAIGSDGALRSYRWGLERKKTLLAHEARATRGKAVTDD